MDFDTLGTKRVPDDVMPTRAFLGESAYEMGALSTCLTRRTSSVALDQTTIAALREQRDRQMLERQLMGDGYEDADLVFAREDGTIINPDSFSDMFWRHVKNAKLPRIRFHDLRHTHATLALAAGVHPKVVSERLGHATSRSRSTPTRTRSPRCRRPRRRSSRSSCSVTRSRPVSPWRGAAEEATCSERPS